MGGVGPGLSPDPWSYSCFMWPLYIYIYARGYNGVYVYMRGYIVVVMVGARAFNISLGPLHCAM
jgi:hypothetical protein